jgi:spore coat-associated protein N
MISWKTLRNNRLLLTGAAFLAVASVAVGGTYANFTATPTTIASNAFASGSLTMSRSGSGAILSASAMKIGDSVSGSVTITNTGNLAGLYTLDGSTTGSSALAAHLQLKIYADADNTGTPVYSGALSGVTSASLGTFAASGGAHTYYFHVTLPTTGTDAGDNAFQGLAASASFTWSATQA